MIRTSHIAAMLTTAGELANIVHGNEDSTLVVCRRGDPPAPWETDPLAVLERAANLARHAAAELEDELLRARHGWPVV